MTKNCNSSNRAGSRMACFLAPPRPNDSVSQTRMHKQKLSDFLVWAKLTYYVLDLSSTNSAIINPTNCPNVFFEFAVEPSLFEEFLKMQPNSEFKVTCAKPHFKLFLITFIWLRYTLQKAMTSQRQSAKKQASPLQPNLAKCCCSSDDTPTCNGMPFHSW